MDKKQSDLQNQPKAAFRTFLSPIKEHDRVELPLRCPRIQALGSGARMGMPGPLPTNSWLEERRLVLKTGFPWSVWAPVPWWIHPQQGHGRGSGSVFHLGHFDEVTSAPGSEVSWWCLKLWHSSWTKEQESVLQNLPKWGREKSRERVLRSFSYKGSCWEGSDGNAETGGQQPPPSTALTRGPLGTQTISFLSEDTLLEESSPEAHMHLLVWHQGQGHGGGPFSQNVSPGDTPVIWHIKGHYERTLPGRTLRVGSEQGKVSWKERVLYLFLPSVRFWGF